MHGALSVVFVGGGIAEINEQAVTQVLCDVAAKVLNDICRAFLISAHDVTQVFGIEFAGEVGGTDEIAEHHGQLPAFGVPDARCIGERT